MSGNDVSDTVGTLLPSPLIVEIRDTTGALAPLATIVRFEPVVDTLFGPEAFVGSLTTPGVSTLASGTTDGSGRTGAFVLLPHVPRDVRIVVRVPTLGLQDTARFVAIVGGIASIQLSPRDTTILAGRGYSLVATVRDRFGNTLAATPSWSAAGSATGGGVSSAGVASATAVGRYRVVAKAGLASDTVQFSAVPEATIVAYDQGRGRIVSVGLDGSNRRDLTTVTDGGIGVRPRWFPASGSTVVFSGYQEPFQSIFFVDSGGNTRPLVNARPPRISHMADAAPTADGAWIFLAAYDTNCVSQGYCLHRIRADGTAIELFEAVRLRPEQSLRPSPSPDGRRVAFNTLIAGVARVRVLDVASNTLLPLDIVGAFPQWSPSSDRIAFLETNGTLSVVNPSGLGLRQLVIGPGYYGGRALTWSPDGTWILYNGVGGLTLVHADDGTVVPLTTLSGLVEPSWR